MPITREDLNDMKMAAAHCDDYTQYKKEIREIRQLEAQLKQWEADNQQRGNNHDLFQR